MSYSDLTTATTGIGSFVNLMEILRFRYSLEDLQISIKMTGIPHLLRKLVNLLLLVRFKSSALHNGVLWFYAYVQVDLESGLKPAISQRCAIEDNICLRREC